MVTRSVSCCIAGKCYVCGPNDFYTCVCLLMKHQKAAHLRPPFPLPLPIGALVFFATCAESWFKAGPRMLKPTHPTTGTNRVAMMNTLLSLPAASCRCRHDCFATHKQLTGVSAQIKRFKQKTCSAQSSKKQTLSDGIVMSHLSNFLCCICTL